MARRESIDERYRRIHGRDVAAEVEDELRFHVAERADALIARGWEAASAQREAERRFGDFDAVVTRCRTEGERMEDERRRRLSFAAWAQDLRFAVRTLRKTPSFTLVAALALALGIGAATSLFGMVDALLLRPLPLEKPEELFELARSKGGGQMFIGVDAQELEAISSATSVIASATATSSYEFSLRTDQQAEVVRGLFVSPNYFEMLGVPAAIGRTFSGGDVHAAGQTAVISHGMWRRRFGSAPEVVGRTIHLNGNAFTVVGVAPKGFATSRVGSKGPDVWIPMSTYTLFEPASPENRRIANIWPLVRLRPGTAPDAAERALDTSVDEGASAGFGGPGSDGFVLQPVDPVGWMQADRVNGFVKLLSIATLFILAIAGINVAGMLLARASTRRREIGIRLAIGASRGRVVRQLLVEGLVLFILGGAAGVLLSQILTQALIAIPWPVPVDIEPVIDLRVLGFALLLSLVTGVGFTLAPALQTTRVDLVPALRAGGEKTTGRNRLRGGVVIVQIALTVVMLVGAMLFVRSMQRAWATDPGFDPDGVIVASIDLGVHGYTDAAAADFYSQLISRITAIPGVEAAGLGSQAPFEPGGGMIMTIEPEGYTPASGQPFEFAHFGVVTPGYFEVLGIDVREGRLLGQNETSVAIVNETFARKYWPNESAVGKRLNEGPAPLTVVGVVKDIKTRQLGGEADALMYLPVSKDGHADLTLHLKIAGDPAPALASTRAIVTQIDGSLPPLSFVPLTDWMGLSLIPQRIGAWMVGGFGVFGLLLALLGLYGLLSYTVTQRTREFGIRLALGAPRAAVLGGVVRHGVLLVGAGVFVGLLAAAAATRIIARFLFGVSPLDPVSFTVVAVLLAITAGAASLIPARRATHIDPAIALRME